MKKMLKTTLLVLITIVIVLAVLVGIVVDFDAMGGSAAGERLERIERSPNYKDGRFVNLEPTEVMLDGSWWASTKEYLFGEGNREPEHPLPSVTPDLSSFPSSDSALEVVWLGHSTVLMAIDGAVLLIDPVFDEAASTVAGLAERFQPSPIGREDLPPVDAVVISHDHYDHLEMSTVKYFVGKETGYIVPLGVGAHLEAWGMPDSQITELDWSQTHRIGNLELVCAPARHFSGRSLLDRNQTLWASFAILGPKHRVFYSGDTGPSGEFEEIGKRHEPFDLTIIQIGAYGEHWPLIHLFPEQVVEVHRAVGGKRLLPVHWGTFDLALHDWDEPVDSTAAVAARERVDLLTPVLGEIVDIDRPFHSRSWWTD